MSDYLYGLTVQGIQSYIFSTNKLKEIIGASEIIEQLCTTWFDKFIKDKKIEGEKYLNAAGNIRFKTSKAFAKLIFKEYHKLLLENAPGVPFSQAVIELTSDLLSQDAILRLDNKLRAQRNKPLFEQDLGIMIRAKARRTGNTGFEFVNGEYLDVVTHAKFNNKVATTLTTKTKLEDIKITYPLEFKHIANNNKHHWLALVHIDGNGMGNLIQKIIKDSTEKTFETLKEFSEKVNTSTLIAFKTAIKEVVLKEGENQTDENDNSYKLLPMRPIIVGGDDVTIIIRADLALAFTKVLLNTFEKETKTKGINDDKGLTACAGIAFVKEKFPFHYAAIIAEELCQFAKDKCKREKSCLQFHRIQDSFINNYKEIIQKDLSPPLDYNYVNGPYYLKQDSTINKLLEDVEKLKQDDAPTNSMRELIDASFRKRVMFEVLDERLHAKTPKNYKEIIKNKKAYIDYHTVLSVSLKN